MKIILSRKGFDSGIGKAPSPILPSDEMFSIPIPESLPSSNPIRYSDIKVGDYCLGTVVEDLSQGKVRPGAFAHLDPDLHIGSIPRPRNWKPVFGQAGIAESHLQRNGVKEGDIFLFFGWFRRVHQIKDKFEYVVGSPDMHVMFGWLQIERRISVHNFSAIPEWALHHPHCKEKAYEKLDCIYIANDYLKLPGHSINVPGAGVFRKYADGLRLSETGMSRSIWRLPNWFYPQGRKSCLSYHSSSERWHLNGDHVRLRTVGRGQEFIIDCDDYPEAIDWLVSKLLEYQ